MMKLAQTCVYDDVRDATITRDDSAVSVSVYDYDASCAPFGTSHGIGFWPSRDPIGEEGFGEILRANSMQSVILSAVLPQFQQEAAYGFVRNTPLSAFDSFGLASSCITCGMDVTEMLANAKTDVDARFAALSPSKKFNNCLPWTGPLSLILTMPGLLSKAANDWDMDNLTHNWTTYIRSSACSPIIPFSENPCSETAWVNDGCYNVWDINYLLFGWLNKQCHDEFDWASSGGTDTLGGMLWRVSLWKILSGKGSEIPQATAWAKAGYLGYPSSGIPEPPPPSVYYTCSECEQCSISGMASEWPHDDW